METTESKLREHFFLSKTKQQLEQRERRIRLQRKIKIKNKIRLGVPLTQNEQDFNDFVNHFNQNFF